MGDGLEAMGAAKSKVGFGEAGDFHLVLKETELKRLVARDGDSDALGVTGFGKDVVAAVDAGEVPTALMEEPHEILTGNLFHAV